MSFRNFILVKILFSIFTINIIAQSDFIISPDQITFEDLFNRIDSTYLINNGSIELTIDSIFYNSSFYSIAFDNNLLLPFSIQPGDSIMMFIYLNGFYYITDLDVTDEIFVFNGGVNSPETLKININFFEDDFGTVTGTVRDSTAPLDSTTIYFFYNGIFLYDKTVTDASGNYEIILPEGEYIIAAEREGYRTIFKDSTYDPYFANLVDIQDDETTVINFYMKKIDDSTKSVSGQITDFTDGITINKGVVIVRKGTHVPSPRPADGLLLQEDTDVFAGFVKPDGSYKVYVSDEDHYFVQTYSDYYLPGYYNDEGYASVFWQNADSILINTNLYDINLSLQKDIAYGGGIAAGSVVLPSYYGFEYDGITLVARSVSTGLFYSYNFVKDNATFRVNYLPYGKYEIIAQKVGLPNAISEQFTVDSLNTSVSGLTIYFAITDVNDNISQPIDYILHQNYPNPFNPSTKISWQSSVDGWQTLKIFDVLGNEIVTLVDEYKPAGKYDFEFNAAQNSRSVMSSGVYFYQLRITGAETSSSEGQAGRVFVQTKKMILLR